MTLPQFLVCSVFFSAISYISLIVLYKKKVTFELLCDFIIELETYFFSVEVDSGTKATCCLIFVKEIL